MKDNKLNTKVVLIFVIFALLLLAIILVFSGNNQGNNINNNSTTSSIDENENEEITSSTELQNVNTYAQYFTITDIINDFYSDSMDDDNTALINKLDSSYVKENNITEDNVIKKVIGEVAEYTFDIKELYYKTINNNLYYFAYGDLDKYNLYKEYESTSAKTYLIIVKDKEFSITPLENVADLKSYAEKYTSKKLVLVENNDNKYTKHSIGYVNVLNYYIAYYNNLAIDQPEKAYSMLDSSMLTKYPTYESFVNDLGNITTIFSNEVYGYKTEGETGNMTYKADMYGSYRITFKENGIKNFKVSF